MRYKVILLFSFFVFFLSWLLFFSFTEDKKNLKLEEICYDDGECEKVISIWIKQPAGRGPPAHNTNLSVDEVVKVLEEREKYSDFLEEIKRSGVSEKELIEFINFDTERNKK